MGIEQSIPNETTTPAAQRPALSRVTNLVHARCILNLAGVRKFMDGDEVIVGVWSDLDCAEARSALRALESYGLPVRYLDGPGVPDEFKSRSVPGEPVPMNVLVEMGQHPAEPWEVRDAHGLVS